MSLIPTTPNLQPRGFWKRPEGKTGMAFVIALGGVGLWALYLALPFIITLTQNLITATISGVVLFALFYVLFIDKTFRTLTSNLFQMSMRWLTGRVIELDPIGILRNNLDQMREKREEVSTAVQAINGSKVSAERAISQRQAEIDKAKAVVQQIDKQLALEKFPEKANLLRMQKQSKLSEAGLKAQSVERVKTMLDRVTKLYSMGCRWRDLADYQIEITQTQVDTLSEERKEIMAMARGMGAMRRILQGDPDQLKLVNQTLEYLADDSSAKLGQLDDFVSFSQKFLTNMDLDNAASADQAEKMFAEAETRLLPPGQTVAVPTVMPGDSRPLEGQYIHSPEPSVSKSFSSGGYDDLAK